MSGVQAQWSPLHHEAEGQGALEWCEARGIPFLAWSPLGSGFLVDGFDLEAPDPADLRRRLRWAEPAGSTRVTRLRAVATEVGRPRRELGLGWAARRADPIVGARNAAEASAFADVTPVDDEAAVRLEAA